MGKTVKYKLLKQRAETFYPYPAYVKGRTYDGNYAPDIALGTMIVGSYSVKALAKLHPNFWEEIKI